MHRVLLLLAIIWGVLAVVKYLKQQPAEKRKALTWKFAVYGLVLVIIALALTGKLHPIGAVIAAAIPFLKGLGALALRFMPSLIKLKQAKFSASVFTTRYLKVEINPLSGKLSGAVLAGDFHGSSLDDLSQDQLAQLQQLYQQQDQESARLLTAYMQQRFQHQSQQQSQHKSQQQTSAAPTAMDKAEALQVLGLTDGANKKDIVTAHRKLMQKLHPDRGGSDYLAAKINQAKDRLLKT
ncbi:MAG: molecular chaperone DnaJ [Cellvibrionaceae bacterium]